jgi:hypothetical protein
MPDSIAPVDSSLTALQPVPAPEAAPSEFIGPHAADLLVPISFFAFTFCVSVLFMYFRFRTRRLIQEERMRAMELRIPVPPEPQRDRGNPFVMPLLLIGSGLGLFLLYLVADGDDRIVALGFAAITFFGGLGWLTAILLNKPARERRDRLAELETQAYVAAQERAGLSPGAPEPPAAG